MGSDPSCQVDSTSLSVQMTCKDGVMVDDPVGMLIEVSLLIGKSGSMNSPVFFKVNENVRYTSFVVGCGKKNHDNATDL